MMRFCGLVVLGLLALNCSSKDDGAGGGSGASGNNPPDMPDIDLPGGGDDVPGSETPGLSDLSPDAVKRLRGDSCAGWSAEPELVPAVLELVVDVSSSMKNKPQGSNVTKWEATRDALLEAIVGDDDEPGLPASTGVGLLFYPNRAEAAINERPGDLTGCVDTRALVPIATLGPKGASHRGQIASAIQNVILNSSTPTHDAFRHALNVGLLPTKVPGSKYMLLITDGAPTLSLGCVNESGSLQDVDPSPIVEEVRVAAEKYAKTFLIGSPGSESNRRWMSQAARIGGTAKAGCSDNGPNYCHMDLTTSTDFAKALREGLGDVAGQIASCSYEMPEPPTGQSIDAGNINVIFTPSGSTDSRLVGRTADAECKEGWVLDGNQVTICPDTCAAIQGDVGATIELLFGCAAVDAPPR